MGIQYNVLYYLLLFVQSAIYNAHWSSDLSCPVIFLDSSLLMLYFLTIVVLCFFWGKGCSLVCFSKYLTVYNPAFTFFDIILMYCLCLYFLHCACHL